MFQFQSERELMKSIIPDQSQSSIFDKLIQAAMEIFISDGEVLSPNFVCIKIAPSFWLYFVLIPKKTEQGIFFDFQLSLRKHKQVSTF